MTDSREPRATERRVVLLTATLTSFMTPFMASSINIALPAIAKEFSLGAVTLTWVATAFILPAAIFLLPFGRLADISGRKRVFAWGVAVFTVASVLCAFSPSAVTLIAFRILQGIAAAMLFSTGTAILTSVYPTGERGRVLGYNVGAVYMGLSLGPSLGGLMVQQLSWRSLFMGSAVLGVITLVSLRQVRGEWAEAAGEGFDLAGTGIYAVSLTALMLGFSALPATAGFGWIVAGAIGLATFLGWELRQRHPVLDVRLLTGNAVFAFSSLAALINYSANFGVTFLLSLYLQYVKELSPQGAGLVLVAQPLIMSGLSPMAGRLSDRMEPRTLASTGMACTALALLLLTSLGRETSLSFIVACLILNGVGFALFSSPNTNAIMSSVERRFYGVASAMTATVRMTGQILSMGTAMLLFALYIGSAPITRENHHLFLASMHVALMIFTAVSVVGVFASLARGTLHSAIGRSGDSATRKP
ncbi:MAG: MFS transporter [candidate division NC10 bacterium]|nr:MFS transporter [candidate division NC10 bacterium]